MGKLLKLRSMKLCSSLIFAVARICCCCFYLMTLVVFTVSFETRRMLLARNHFVCVCVCAHVNIGECGVTSDNKANNKRER